MRTIIQGMRLLVVLSLLLGVDALAEEGNIRSFFTWTDKAGVVHAADSLEKVPEEYRSRARRIDQGPADGNAVPGTQSIPDQGRAEINEETLKGQWQARVLDAKRRLQYAEDTYQQLVKRKSDLQAQWGSAGAALPPGTVLEELKQLDSDIEVARQEIDKARDLIDNVIPDEARRAGVPPGWLREAE